MSESLFSLKGKSAVVTGAAGLLGKQHCMALRDAGAIVYACDIDDDNCRKNFFGEEQIISCKIDITNPDSIQNTLNLILKTSVNPDILVNNAAINDKFEEGNLKDKSMFEKYPLTLWEKSLKVNLTGTFLCSQIFGTQMLKAGKGSIINIASIYGIISPDQKLYKRPDGTQDFYKTASYPVTKAGVIALTRYLAAYWGGKGIRVNCLSPGGVENNQDDYFIQNYSARTPLGRMAQPSDYKGALVFLASDASSYMTGANLVVDGGFTIW